MENKIQVEEYIRTYDGIIGKVKRIELDEIDKSLKWYVFDKKRYDMNIIDEIYINKPYIKKHSFNIIDLIEEGDFIKIKDEYFEDVYLILDTESWLNRVKREMLNDYFKLVSIVTKEQFKIVEYEV